jgi:hypothetical protein
MEAQVTYSFGAITGLLVLIGGLTVALATSAGPGMILVLPLLLVRSTRVSVDIGADPDPPAHVQPEPAK